MSGLSHTPGKRAWGKTHRGFESRLLRQKQIARSVMHYGLFCCPFPAYLLDWTIFMAVAIRPDTSLMLPGMMRVVVASAATLA
jgi:hypothetical protein